MFKKHLKNQTINVLINKYRIICRNPEQENPQGFFQKEHE